MVAAMQEIGEVSHQAAAGAKQTVNAANDLTQLGENLEELIISR
jgi:methyl-accepting chemotaxis protein